MVRPRSGWTMTLWDNVGGRSEGGFRDEVVDAASR